MKQSKKLLSIFLAMLMLLGTVSVIGNAAQQKVTEETKGEIKYDSVDNAVLTADQVAFIIIDMLDSDVMPGLGKMDLSILGSLDLTSVDNALSSVYDLLGGFLLGLLAGGDADTLIEQRKQLLFKGTDNKEDVVCRADGDLQVVYQLLQFIGNSDVAGVLAKAPKGLLTSNGINIGTLNGIVAGFVDLSSINDILTNIPGFLGTMVFDMLLYGSYGYDKDSEELKGQLPSSADTLDEIVNEAVTGLLTKPQKYSYVDGVKTWDMDSKILNLTAQEIAALDLNIAKNSIFTILDKALPIAYETFGTVVLNHDVKKIFMEAMGVDFVRITDAAEIESIKTTSATNAINKYIDVETAERELKENGTTNIDTSSVKNYFCNAQMWKVGDTWYFRDYVTTEIGTDATTGEPITEKQHRFFKAQTYSVDDLYEVFNWDYYLTADSLDFAEMLKAADGNDSYGSLVGSLNHIIHVIFENAISSEFLTSKDTSVDALWADGGNDKFNENLMNTAKFLLINYTFMFFGRNEAYVDLETLEPKQAFVNKINSFDSESAIDREGLIAYILLPFLGDALPQLVYDMDMFTDGLQIEQTAALLVREFLSDLTPQINYDDQIFEVGTLTSASGRTFKTHTSAEWMDIVLNMGLDLAAVYLDNIANFGVDLDALEELHTITKDAAGNAVQPWQVVLEEIVDWAVLYVGSGSNSAIKGLEPSTIGVARCITYNYKDDSYSFNKDNFVGGSGKGSAFFTLSTALNTLLPLGIVNGCSTKNYSLDVEVLFNKIKGEIIPSLDLEALIGLFGRNVDPNGNNFLANTNIPYQIVSIVNKVLGAVLGKTILQPGAVTNTTPLNTMLQADNLGTTIKNLVMGLNDRKVPLLTSVLPVLAIFVSGWGTEQELGSPEIALGDTITADDSGNVTDYSVTIRNGSAGIWRSYMATDGNGNVTGNRLQDNQYSYKITNVSATVLNKKATVSGIEFTKDAVIKYGGKTTFTFDASGVPEYGALVRFVVTYTVFDEANTEVVDGLQFNKVQYCFINKGAQDSGSASAKVDDAGVITQLPASISVPRYIYISDENVASLGTSTQITITNAIEDVTATGSFTPGSTTAQAGIALKAYSKEVAKNGGSASVSMFNTINYTGSVGEDGKVYSFTGNKVAISRPKISFINGAKNAETSFDFKLVVYSGEYKSKLESLVNDEITKDRKEYNFSKSSFAVPEEYTEEDTNYFGGSINGTAAWNEYTEALYIGATRIFQNERTAVSLKTIDYKTVYERLYKAVNDLDVCELSDGEKMEQETAHGAVAPDTAVEYVKGFLDSAEEKVGEKDYRTYMLYRWNKYTSVRKSINNAIELQKRAKTPAETQRFPYRGISIAELNEILAMDAYKGYASYVTALLEDLSEDEIARNAKEHSDAVRDYANLDIAEQAVNAGYITMAVNRLIKRTSAPVTYYLEKEIASAENQIGKADATNTKYSAKSWDIYVEALKAAKTAMASDSQDVIFSAKYQLQVARNGLILAVDEADYKELDTLIDQAKNALATHTGNKNIYKNSDEDFGKLLAALGLEVTNSNGDTFELFPGAALDVQSTPYSSHDQDEVDDAADKLKAALAKLEFKNFNSAMKPKDVTLTTIATGEEDDEGKAITEDIYTAKINAKQAKKDVATALAVSGCTVEVSLDEKYSASSDANLDKIPVGTGATVTIIKNENGVKIPVATIKVVVNGDVTGDGVVDALDCMIADLCISNQASLGGVYFIAGNLAQNDAIDVDDFTQIVNEAVKVS